MDKIQKIVAQLKNRNKREKADVPKTRRMIFERVKNTLYNSDSSPILLGLRRVGKTTIFRQLLIDDQKAFLIPFDDLTIRTISNLELAELFQSLYDEGYRTFLIDEAQDLEEWDIKIFGLINSFRDSKFAITGSSSLNISKRETGLDRTEVINISTLTFDEYLTLKGLSRDNFDYHELKAIFENFLGTGGFPAYVNSEDFIETIYKLKENILKDLIDNDISRTYDSIKASILNKIIHKISLLTNGELNKTEMTKGIDRFTQRELDEYLDVMEKARIIKTVEALRPDGSKMMRPKIKVYLNPHIHIWLLEQRFAELDPKRKGHLIESYWLTWVDSVNRVSKKHYYIKDKKGLEIDFVSLNADGSFKTLHEFKYSNSHSMNSLFVETESKNKVVWCLEDKEQNGIKYISIINSNDAEGIKH